MTNFGFVYPQAPANYGHKSKISHHSWTPCIHFDFLINNLPSKNCRIDNHVMKRKQTQYFTLTQMREGLKKWGRPGGLTG